MISAIIELGIGYFLTYKVPGILGLSKNISLAIKIIGILLIIIGFVDFVQHIGKMINL